MFKYIISFSLVCLLSGSIFAQQPDYNSLQQSIRAIVDKVYPATVCLSPYDTVNKRVNGGMFSGVVISPEGTIITAAHAASPNRMYKVIFPDGKEALAKGLGRIESVDAAIVQLTTGDHWPYAEMGWSSEVQVADPCISMGYPGSLEQKAKPIVRFGYVGEASTSAGFIRSTCLMEPGDSGGPLFDLNGRVIGIHSRIEKGLESNYEIPVDAFHKYWHSLLTAENYQGKSLPAAETVTPDFLPLPPFPGSSTLDEQIAGLETKLEKNCIAVSSNVEGQHVTILGTLVSMKDLLSEEAQKGYSFVISKSSMVGDTPVVEGAKSKMNAATIIKRDLANDLVLLKIQGKNKNAVELDHVVEDAVLYHLPGQFLLSPHPANEGELSVLGAGPISLPRRSTAGFLGVTTESKDGALVLTMVSPRTAASEAMLERGDKIVSINGMAVKETEDLIKILGNYQPKDTILFKGIRQDSVYAKSIVLQARPAIRSTHIAEFFEDGKSVRKDGFKTVLVHDGKVKPAECGGPLFDTAGHFLGINIARISRTSTLAIPAVVVQEFLKAAVTF